MDNNEHFILFYLKKQWVLPIHLVVFVTHKGEKNFNLDLPTEVTLELMWLKTKGTYCLAGESILAFPLVQ